MLLTSVLYQVIFLSDADPLTVKPAPSRSILLRCDPVGMLAKVIFLSSISKSVDKLVKLPETLKSPKIVKSP